MLPWSLGPADHPQHPGDDEKARQIAASAKVVPYPTERLQQLIGALAACDAVICSDGGASHIAAALGKPMVCLFGDSPVERWRPWRAPVQMLRPSTSRVVDISVEDAVHAFATAVRNRELGKGVQ
jgi:ADP-heptose:LPS heptosyltransferase